MRSISVLVLLPIFLGLPSMYKAVMDINDLYIDLVQGEHKKNLSPTVLGNQVGVFFRLFNIFKFDELSGTFGVSGMFEMYWNDTRLKWTPSAYDFEYQILLPEKSVWVPHLVPLTFFGEKSPVTSYDNKVRYYATGESHYLKTDVFYGKCTADFSHYPYDTHKCTMTLVPWGYYKEEIDIVTLEETADMAYFSSNSMWDVVSTKTYTRDLVDPEEFESPTSAYEIEINLKRRNSSFYLLNIILPLVLMEVLHLFVFLLPQESGERISYSVTILLAVAVFMTIVTSYVPVSSDSQIPLIILKVFLDLVISCWIQMCVIINARVYISEKEKPTSSLLQRIGRMCWCCKRKTDTYEVEKDENEATWADVGRVMDIFFGFISFILILTSNIYFGFLIFDNV